MKRKIIRGSLLGFCLLIGFQSVANAEYRCGWLDNPAAGEYQFTDKSASWTIRSRRGYQLPANSLKNLPEPLESEYVRSNGRFGYSCACLSVTTDASSKRITSILHKGKQVLLKRCLEDKTIVGRQSITLRFPKPAKAVSNPISLKSVARPSGSYTDTPVIAGRSNAEVGSGYYDEPKPSGNTNINKSQSSAKGRAKSHYIQVIVTSIPAKAKRLKKSYDKAGFKTIVSEIKRKNKLLHKVKIGPYPSRRAVLNSQIKLRKLFKKDQGVQKSIIVG